MRVRALRGVCVGPSHHLVKDETADIDAATAQFLISIRAVERVLDEPPKEEPAKAESPKAEAKNDAPKPDNPSVKSKEK